MRYVRTNARGCTWHIERADRSYGETLCGSDLSSRQYGTTTTDKPDKRARRCARCEAVASDMADAIRRFEEASEAYGSAIDSARGSAWFAAMPYD